MLALKNARSEKVNCEFQHDVLLFSLHPLIPLFSDTAYVNAALIPLPFQILTTAMGSFIASLLICLPNFVKR